MTPRRAKRDSRTRAPKPAATPRRPISRRRKWLFRLSAALLGPLLLLGGLELSLRLLGYGYPANFLVQGPAKDTLVSNPRFGWRFFPRPLSREPVPLRLQNPKPSERYRIFVLGESAAQGVPSPENGFGRILEVLLRERYPGADFDVVNAAVTAVDSHAVRAIARECAGYQPDLFVVYMGNNEVIGPYGPGAGFANALSSRRAIRAGLWLKTTRTGQWIADLAGAFRSGATGKSGWRALESLVEKPVGADDPRLPAVYDNFRANLSDILSAARKAGAAAVVSTVAVNLADCPPFLSLHRQNLSDSDRRAWDGFYAQGLAHRQAGRPAQAIESFRQAANLDDTHAELHFHLAGALADLHLTAEAAREFRLALQNDAVRVRADRKINDLIRQAVEDADSSRVVLADADTAFAAQAPPAPGHEHFHEHVHMTFRGNYALAALVAEQAARLLPESIRRRQHAAGWLSMEQCRDLVPYTAREEARALMAMARLTAGPPFSRQAGHALRQQHQRDTLASLRRQARAPGALAHDVELHKNALNRSANDCLLKSAYADLLLDAGRPDEAAKPLEELAKLFPDDVVLLTRRARAEAARKRFARAEELLRQAIQLRPGRPATHFLLAETLVLAGEPGKAASHLEALSEQAPDDAELRYEWAQALLAAGKIDDAVAQLRRAVQLDEAYAKAHHSLGLILRKTGKAEEAISSLLQAQRDPEFRVESARALSLLYAARGDMPALEGQCRLLLEENPADPHAAVYLADAVYRQGRYRQALALARQAEARHPESAGAKRLLAWQLASCPDGALRDGAGAVRLAGEACRLAGNEDPACLDTLAAAYAEAGRFPEATQAARHALTRLAASPAPPALLQREIRSRLEGYEAGRCFRVSPPPAPNPSTAPASATAPARP